MIFQKKIDIEGIKSSLQFDHSGEKKEQGKKIYEIDSKLLKLSNDIHTMMKSSCNDREEMVKFENKLRTLSDAIKVTPFNSNSRNPFSNPFVYNIKPRDSTPDFDPCDSDVQNKADQWVNTVSASIPIGNF